MAGALIEVSFKGNRKDFFLWEQEDAPPPPIRSAVIVEADRGEDLGYVHALGELAEKRNSGTPHGYGAAGTRKKARRLATDDDVSRAKELRVQDDDARRRAAERVRANNLAMKLTDAEWQWDRKKLTLYFTAEKRVDFRTLVRELASMFRTRIELKQIGVRDEAKRLDGVGRCGRQYCSASWLPELRPVNLGVAKDQRLSLNPSQISGACGRLMCCLRYEHEFYAQSRKRFPKEGRSVTTSRGEEKVVSNDIFRERVTLRGMDGELRTITLVELRAEADKAGAPLPVVATTPSSFADESADAVDLRDSTELALEAEIEEVLIAAESIEVARVETIESVESVDVEDAADDVDDDEETEIGEAESETTASAADGAPADGASRERRPHRRRGRRGGRRNRGRGHGGGGGGGGGGSGNGRENGQSNGTPGNGPPGQGGGGGSST